MYRIQDDYLGTWPFRIANGGTVERYHRVKGQWIPLIGIKDSIGYMIVTYKSEGQPRVYAKVHRIVWQTYNGVIPKEMEIDHIDGDKTNNNIANLRLVTHQENMKLAHDRLGNLGNWAVKHSKITLGQMDLLLAMPEGWRCLKWLAVRWDMSKFSLGNIRAKAKRENDPRYLQTL